MILFADQNQFNAVRIYWFITIGRSMKLSRLKLYIKFLKLGFSVDIMKSPSRTKFSCTGLKKLKATFNSLIDEIILRRVFIITK